jgi:hypothetical protein
MSDDVPRMLAHTPRPCVLAACLHQALHDLLTLGCGNVVVLDEYRHRRAGRDQH